MRQILFSTVALASLAVATSISAEEQAPAPGDPPRVLLLGDSISIAYTPLVREILADQAFVARPTAKNGKAENCADTTTGVAKIDDWLARDGGDWDVIHLNFGLHDLKHVDPATGKNANEPGHPHQVDPKTYGEQLDAIVTKCRATGARVIVATTTPVPEGGVKPFRDPADVRRYNAVAVELAEKHGASVDDLFAFAEPRLAEIQRPVNVHFTDAGSRALAEEVVRSIRAALATENADAASDQ